MRSAPRLRQRHDGLGEDERFVRSSSAVNVELIDRLASPRHVTSARSESHRLHRFCAIDCETVCHRSGFENASRHCAERLAYISAAVGWDQKDDAAATA